MEGHPSAALVGFRYLLHLVSLVITGPIPITDAIREWRYWHLRRWRLAGTPGPACSEDFHLIDWAVGWDADVIQLSHRLRTLTQLARYTHRGTSWVRDIKYVQGDLTADDIRHRVRRLTKN